MPHPSYSLFIDKEYNLGQMHLLNHHHDSLT